MAYPNLALRPNRNVLVSHYVVAGSKNPLPLGMGECQDRKDFTAHVLPERKHYGEKETSKMGKNNTFVVYEGRKRTDQPFSKHLVHRSSINSFYAF